MDNTYHKICCGEIGIMYGWEIVEGKYHTIPMGRPEFETSPNMKTVVLMLQLTILLWITGKEVIMYRGFCVLKGLLELKKRVVYGSRLINRCDIGIGGYW